jgi:hypothetical protein
MSHAAERSRRDVTHLRDLPLDAPEAGDVNGGIDTVPLPTRTLSTVAIGTWPTPERPAPSILGSLRRFGR